FARLHVHLVRAGILERRRDRLRLTVQGDHPAVAEFRRRNREDARAAAEVRERSLRFKREERLEAPPGGWVRPCSERAGVLAQDDVDQPIARRRRPFGPEDEPAADHLGLPVEPALLEPVIRNIPLSGPPEPLTGRCENGLARRKLVGTPS